MKNYIYFLAAITFFVLYKYELIETNFKVYYFYFALSIFAIYSLIIEINSDFIPNSKKKSKYKNINDVDLIKNLCESNFENIIKNRILNQNFLINKEIKILFPITNTSKSVISNLPQYITLESFKVFKIDASKNNLINRVFAEVYFSFFTEYNPQITIPDDKIWKLEHWVFEINSENIWQIVNTDLEASLKFNLKSIIQKITRSA
ncbi:hypothetical protein [Leptospira paudalimensis]|uniref:Tim44-like domain-containing protein n=1 Tax=Leptospira paudalimensis TaxID=2950024 RepID=A0ABT3M5A5_9LEPT|nr:hypothetical protein [Leptospira paudalimensis]MCW7503548.1 hypothetical protein [Leptospira paudalimensis]